MVFQKDYNSYTRTRSEYESQVLHIVVIISLKNFSHSGEW